MLLYLVPLWLGHLFSSIASFVVFTTIEKKELHVVKQLYFKCIMQTLNIIIIGLLSLALRGGFIDPSKTSNAIIDGSVSLLIALEHTIPLTLFLNVILLP